MDDGRIAGGGMVMKRRTMMVLPLGLAMALPGAAVADTAPPFACPAVSLTDHWKRIDALTIAIETEAHLAYKVTFTNTCRKLKSSVLARIESQPGNLMCLSPGDVMIFGRGQSFPDQRYEFEERCTIKSVEPIEASE
jgi:hypothetical protein